MATCDIMYMRSIFEHMNMELKEPTRMFVDNKGVVDIARDPLSTTALKHVKRRHFFVREAQDAGEIVVMPVTTNLNFADVLTKQMTNASWLQLLRRIRDGHEC